MEANMGSDNDRVELSDGDRDWRSVRTLAAEMAPESEQDDARIMYGEPEDPRSNATGGVCRRCCKDSGNTYPGLGCRCHYCDDCGSHNRVVSEYSGPDGKRAQRCTQCRNWTLREFFGELETTDRGDPMRAKNVWASIRRDSAWMLTEIAKARVGLALGDFEAVIR
jgi:hypothetical protein